MARDEVRHPDAERLAEYADGVLEAGARAEVERHLADCAACRAVVMETMAFLESPVAAELAPAATVIPFRSRRWVTGVVAGLAVAAALVLAIRVARPEWVFGPRGDRPQLDALIAALSKEPTRPVEGRLMGLSAYAPPPSPTRGSQNAPRISATTADAIEKTTAETRAGTDADSREAFGVAALVAGRVDEALAALEDAARLRPTSARIQSDLSAAYLERTRFGTNPGDLQRALQAAQSAIAQDPAILEALFNRALALERLERKTEALKAWEEYRRRDPKGPWSAEAVRHALTLMGLPQANPASVFRPVTGLTTHSVPLVFTQQTSILINAGHESSDYPASFWASLNEDGCSVTFVGPLVVLTAAHCVVFDHGVIWLYRESQPTLSGRCDRATNFRRDSSGVLYLDDWALCKMESRAPVAAEVVNIDPSLVVKQAQVIVTGFGCDLINGKPDIGESFGVGYMKVADPDYNGTGLIWATPIHGTTLCNGDSGGGTFVGTPDGRLVAAANSYSDNATMSTMSNLSSNPGREFLYTWSGCHAAPICGLDATLDTTECRQLMPPGNAAHLPTSYTCPPGWQEH